jgi:hypothetical protein
MKLKPFVLAGLCSLTLTACVTTGGNRTAVTGSVGGGSSVGASAGLEHCPETLGTLAVDDGRGANYYGPYGSPTRVTSVEPLIRLAAQQSNCFIITSAGNMRTDSRMMRLTQMQRNSGEYRAGSRQHKGQRVAADYFLEPRVIIDSAQTGSMFGGLAGATGLGGFGRFGSLVGGLNTKSSVVTLSLFDIRSSVQIAAAEGSSTATNYGAALGALGGGVGAGLGGYSSTPEGQATVAAFVDAYNGMVRALKHYRAQSVRGGSGRGGVLRVN